MSAAAAPSTQLPLPHAQTLNSQYHHSAAAQTRGFYLPFGVQPNDSAAYFASQVAHIAPGISTPGVMRSARGGRIALNEGCRGIATEALRVPAANSKSNGGLY